MAVLSDLSPFVFYGDTDVVAVGWLGRGKPFPTGDSTSEFLDRLLLFTQNPPRRFTTGVPFTCELCGQAEGAGEVRILAPGVVYAAPVLIHHYITAHSYLPPTEFIRAVLAAPLPESLEMVDRFGPPSG